MIIAADFYNATRTIQYNTSPVILESVNRSEALDAAGPFSFSVPWLDPVVRNLIQPQRFVSIQIFNEEGKWEFFASGFIEQIKSPLNAGDTVKTVSCVNSMQELKYRSALLARVYDNVSLNFAVADLISRAGWLVQYSGEDRLVSARFDGPNLLKCLIELTKVSGLHFRLATAQPRTIEFGELGDLSDIVLVNADTAVPDKTQIAVIDNLVLQESSEQLINIIIPLGGGEGDAAITLEHSTRDNIDTMVGPGGATIYFIQHDASVSMYGAKEEVVAFKEVQQVDMSVAGQIAAANLLYDSAFALLLRSSTPARQYSLNVVTPVSSALKILPGQKIQMKYLGPVRDHSGQLLLEGTYIDETFWILSVRESISASGRSLSLVVSTTDRVMRSEDEVIASVVEKSQAQVVRVQPYPVTFTVSRYDTWGPHTNGGGKNGDYILRINDQFTNITKVIATLHPKPIHTVVEYDFLNGTPNKLFGVYSVHESSYFPIVDVYLSHAGLSEPILLAKNLAGSHSVAWGPVDFDITQYILASGDIYQTFAIVVVPVIELITAVEDHAGDDFYPSYVDGLWTALGTPFNAGWGIGVVDFTVSATVQANNQ